MTKFRFVVLKCQDCAYFESSKTDPDHAGRCLNFRVWADPFSRTCSYFIAVDDTTTRIHSKASRTIVPPDVITGHKGRKECV